MTRVVLDDAPQAEEHLPPVVVPKERLHPITLRALLVERASRDGTDYGLIEASLEAKVAELSRLLDRGEVVITFDPNTESCNLVLAREVTPCLEAPS